MNRNQSLKRKPPYSLRHETPNMKVENGKAVILCPFCNPSHELSLREPAACGTILEVRASQLVHNAFMNKEMVCIKCKKGVGKMVQYNDAFVHVPDCNPDILLFSDPTKFSRMAKLVFHAPAWLRVRLEKRFGQARVVDQVTPGGVSTGKVSGYYFHKKA